MLHLGYFCLACFESFISKFFKLSVKFLLLFLLWILVLKLLNILLDEKVIAAVTNWQRFSSQWCPWHYFFIFIWGQMFILVVVFLKQARNSFEIHRNSVIKMYGVSWSLMFVLLGYLISCIWLFYIFEPLTKIQSHSLFFLIIPSLILSLNLCCIFN